MKASQEHYQALFDEIRMMQNRLRWIGDRIHAEASLTGAKRSLMYSLYRHGPQTVPAMAEERLVSRQIVQTQINLLLAEKRVSLLDNPRHKRSSLVALTARGRQEMEAMLAVEADLLANADLPFDRRSVESAQRLLEQLRTRLEQFQP